MARARAKRGRGRWRRWWWRLLGLLVLLPWLVVGVLRWVDPPLSAFMLGYLLQRGADDPVLQHEWVPLASISPHLQIAVIAAEDQRFAEHAGFDLPAIRDAVTDGGRRGASTISQQVAKNLFLWPGRSWLRKALEAGLTVCIEALWSKERILEVYLNVAEFAPGVYGAQAAARHHFGRDADRIEPRQAALLAAVLPNPHRLSASRPSAYVLRRARWIERQVGQLGGVAGLARVHGQTQDGMR